MTQFHEYLIEEVVEDYSDGMISRREALRRLGLLGMTAAVAGPLLAACDTARPGAGAETPTASPTGSASAGPSARPTEPITFAGPDNRTVQGAWAAAATPRGGVVVVHENRG